MGSPGENRPFGGSSTDRGAKVWAGLKRRRFVPQKPSSNTIWGRLRGSEPIAFPKNACLAERPRGFPARCPRPAHGRAKCTLEPRNPALHSYKCHKLHLTSVGGVERVFLLVLDSVRRDRPVSRFAGPGTVFFSFFLCSVTHLHTFFCSTTML